jgi:dipeptidyl aminopeptidase/acylaminoacyl peptidase
VSNPYIKELRRRFLRALRDSKPKFVVAMPEVGRFAGRDIDLRFEELDTLLRESYVPVVAEPAFILYERRDLPSRQEIYVMNADGSAQTRLTDDADDEQTPSWSPDGTKIAFTRVLDGVNPEIYVMKSSGASLLRITRNSMDAPRRWFAREGLAGPEPRWSERCGRRRKYVPPAFRY